MIVHAWRTRTHSPSYTLFPEDGALTKRSTAFQLVLVCLTASALIAEEPSVQAESSVPQITVAPKAPTITVTPEMRDRILSAFAAPPGLHRS